MNSYSKDDVITEPMAPLGMALWDYYHQRPLGELMIVRADGYADKQSIEHFFSSDLSLPGEKEALDLCRGKVLDVGAGAGRHSLILQERGFDVTAIDISAQAVEIMKDRKVRDVKHASISEYNDGRFDTVLMFSHGLGIAGDLDGLGKLLKHASKIITPGGQIIGDSLDVRCTQKPVHLEYQQAQIQVGAYVGEMRFNLKYKDVVGPEFGWLHVDFATLSKIAREHSWYTTLICQNESGDYWCQLIYGGS